MLFRGEQAGRVGRGAARRLAILLTLVLVGTGLLAACSPGPASQAHADASSPSPVARSSAAVQSVPIKVVRHGESALELVPVFIGGHGPYTFVLDTGSSVSSVSKQLATVLHLPLTGASSTISGVVKSKKVPVASIRAWKMGNVPLAPERVAVLNGSLPGGTRVKGLLGSDELSRFGTVTLDFAHDQLRLTHP